MRRDEEDSCKLLALTWLMAKAYFGVLCVCVFMCLCIIFLLHLSEKPCSNVPISIQSINFRSIFDVQQTQGVCFGQCVFLCVCLCVCVRVRKREKERDRARKKDKRESTLSASLLLFHKAGHG